MERCPGLLRQQALHHHRRLRGGAPLARPARQRVDPGWVPTRMGGPGAPDDLDLGHVTQAWLAASGDRDATRTGGYWYHQRRQSPAPSALDKNFQPALLDQLIRL